MNKKSNDQPQEQKLIFLDMADIKRNPDQPRKEFDQQEVDKLAESIKAFGQLYPIIVAEPNSSGKYMIEDGEMRFRACQVLGQKSIKAQVQGVEDKDEIYKLSVQANRRRVALSDPEWEEVVSWHYERSQSRGHSKEPHSTRQVADWLGESDTEIIRILKAREIRARLAPNGSKLSTRTLYDVADIIRTDELLTEFVKKIERGEVANTRAEARLYAKEHKESGGKQEFESHLKQEKPLGKEKPNKSATLEALKDAIAEFKDKVNPTGLKKTNQKVDFWAKILKEEKDDDMTRYLSVEPGDIDDIIEGLRIIQQQARNDKKRRKIR
jgi:ParB/RepB/Spo0J family partition protein